MSRAININASEADIQATCERLGIAISMAERLDPAYLGDEARADSPVRGVVRRG
jgi:hypothetical protein